MTRLRRQPRPGRAARRARTEAGLEASRDGGDGARPRPGAVTAEAAPVAPALAPPPPGRDDGRARRASPRPARSRAAWLAPGLAACALAAGCGLLHHGPPPPPPIFIPQPPLIFPAPPPAPMPAPAVLSPALVPAPALAAGLADAVAYGPPPPRFYRRAPSFRRPPAAAAPPPLATPPLTAGLSPRQQARYRRQAAATLRQAGAVLQLLQSRRLSPAASATRAQANEYVRQARQALALGDVVRAQTLADKAITLARFLAGQ